jgi:hypothetical protein
MSRRAALLTLCLVACHHSEASAPSPDASVPSAKRATVRGQVVLSTQTYCGGAPPSDDMVLSKRAPEPGKRLLVRRGSENTASEVLAQPTSDASGTFKVSLPPGTYCFIEEAKRELTPKGPPPANVDPSCLESRRRTCDAVVEVPDKGEVSVTVEFHKGCLPECADGPFPP